MPSNPYVADGHMTHPISECSSLQRMITQEINPAVANAKGSGDEEAFVVIKVKWYYWISPGCLVPCGFLATFMLHHTGNPTEDPSR
ncbi:hypothetical protein RSAG8_13608, partial [Rhizoctonia solani AG-8 WAC10335]